MVNAGLYLAIFLLALSVVPDFPPLIWEDDDRKTIPEPSERKVSAVYDFVRSTFGDPAFQLFDFPRHVRSLAQIPKEAENINAVDEVPNSSWYTNRNFLHPMTADDAMRGPSTPNAGPAGGKWTVIACKTDGITPGLRIRDANGDVYLLKFDPPEYRDLATAADVIGSKIFYAAGYNVPSNSIVVFPRDRLVIPANVRCLVGKIARTKDGQIRAMASKFLDGKPKGPFSYEGWRNDDPNDVIPHEHRRELRGLKVVASFINHNDIKQLNTLDTYVEENGRKYIKHHFVDYGATLGSATISPKQGSEGREYLFDVGEVLKSTFTLGLYRRKILDDPAVVHPSIGFLDGNTFDPGSWKPNQPIASFENMTDRDAYWGAKIVAAFTDEHLRAFIRTGQYSDPAAADILFEILKTRRDRIARYWFRRLAPIDRFRIENGRLAWDDLAVAGGYDCAACVDYAVEVHGPEHVIIRRSPGWPELRVSVYVDTANGTPAVAGVKR